MKVNKIVERKKIIIPIRRIILHPCLSFSDKICTQTYHHLTYGPWDSDANTDGDKIFVTKRYFCEKRILSLPIIKPSGIVDADKIEVPIV